MTRTPIRTAVVLGTALLGLSGCGLAQLGTSPRPADAPPAGPGVSAAPSPTRSPKAVPRPRPEPGIVLRARATARFGTLVVDARGRTLYRSERDRSRPPLSRCVGKCARTWPPATVAGPDQVRVAGIDPDLVGTLRRADGRHQLTLAGHPLYRFAQDRRPGDIKGQCRDNVFFAATPEGGRTTMAGINA
jgi:predicted lipoprotein with Yx(FWY)xxD motif